MTRTKAETKRGGLRCCPRREGRGGLADHALAALEAFNMAGLASCHPATVERGLRELRALLAVARAAAKHMDACHYPPGAAVAGTTTDRLWNALARLARAGSGRRGT